MKVAGAVLTFGLWLSSTALAQDYEIRLHRPATVGQKYRMSAAGRQSRKDTVTQGGQAAQAKSQGFSLEFESVVTVLETDKKGMATKESHTVAKCVKIQGGARKSLVPKGTVIVGSATEKATVFESGGRPVAPEVREALSLVIDLSKGGATADEIFGTRERKKVGQSWNMNTGAAAKDLHREGIEIRKEDIRGATTLEKVGKVGQTECLQIRGEMTLKNLMLPLPPWLKLEKSAGHARVSGKFPLDTSIGVLEMSLEMSLTFRAKGKPDPNAQEVIVESSLQSRVTKQRTYLK